MRDNNNNRTNSEDRATQPNGSWRLSFAIQFQIRMYQGVLMIFSNLACTHNRNVLLQNATEKDHEDFKVSLRKTILLENLLHPVWYTRGSIDFPCIWAGIEFPWRIIFEILTCKLCQSGLHSVWYTRVSADFPVFMIGFPWIHMKDKTVKIFEIFKLEHVIHTCLH